MRAGGRAFRGGVRGGKVLVGIVFDGVGGIVLGWVAVRGLEWVRWVQGESGGGVVSLVLMGGAWCVDGLVGWGSNWCKGGWMARDRGRRRC